MTWNQFFAILMIVSIFGSTLCVLAHMRLMNKWQGIQDRAIMTIFEHLKWIMERLPSTDKKRDIDKIEASVLNGVHANPVDVREPEVKPGDLKCDGCWAISGSTIGWSTFNFKHLKQTWLCLTCTPRLGQDLANKQAAGL